MLFSHVKIFPKGKKPWKSLDAEIEKLMSYPPSLNNFVDYVRRIQDIKIYKEHRSPVNINISLSS